MADKHFEALPLHTVNQSASNLSELEYDQKNLLSPTSAGSQVSVDYKAELPNKAKSSVFMATMNFTNSIIGAGNSVHVIKGIMGLPYAFQQGGFFASILLLISLTVIVGWSVSLLIECGKLSGTQNYQHLVDRVFGRWGYLSISIFQFLFAFGAMCAYLIIIADNLTRAFENYTTSIVLTHRVIVLTFSSFVILLPLCSMKDLSKLSSVSMASLVAVAMMVIVIGIQGPTYALPKSSDAFYFIHKNLFQAIGVMSFAFVCHHNSFLIYDSMRVPTIKRFSRVTYFSLAISLVACLSLAIPGYLSFTSKTKGNILSNFPKDDLVINIARIIFALTMFLTYPMELFVTREVLSELFFKKTRRPNLIHYVVTFILLGASFGIAAIFTDLGVVFELTGGFSASVIAYIMPPACFIRLSNAPTYSFKKLGCWILIVFGVVVMVLRLDFDSSSLSPVDSEWTDSGYAGKDDQDTIGSYHCGEPAELFLDESMSIKETYEYCKASKYDIHKIWICKNMQDIYLHVGCELLEYFMDAPKTVEFSMEILSNFEKLFKLEHSSTEFIEKTYQLILSFFYFPNSQVQRKSLDCLSLYAESFGCASIVSFFEEKCFEDADEATTLDLLYFIQLLLTNFKQDTPASLFKAFLFGLIESASFDVRKETIEPLVLVHTYIPDMSDEAFMLYCRLCDDSVWSVREKCTMNLAEIAAHSLQHQTIISLCSAFLQDTSSKVKNSMMDCLGMVITYLGQNTTPFLFDSYLDGIPIHPSKFWNPAPHRLLQSSFCFPGVLVTFANIYWQKLKPLLIFLSNHDNWKVRLPIASSINQVLHQIDSAEIKRELFNCFRIFIQGQGTKVKGACLESFASSLKHFHMEDQIILVQELLRQDESKWRLRLITIRQMLLFPVELLELEEVVESIDSFLKDPVYEVRSTAILLPWHIYSQTKTLQKLVVKMLIDLAISPSFVDRITFAKSCFQFSPLPVELQVILDSLSDDPCNEVRRVVKLHK